uniref:Uncharacterized protein n=1 Tax=Acrobeloides nanus TaxID=290746 RepID=A0A914D363_9BILA
MRDSNIAGEYLPVGDAIEVVEANDGNTFFGRLVEFPGKSGIVKCDCVKSMGITINRRHSSNSIVNSPNTPVADMSPMERPRSLVSREVLKINEGLSVECQPWFFGEIEREKANELLEGTADGTFIVRVSPNQRQFVVSVSYAGRQKHMKIEIKPETGEFYLHDGRMLPSVVELINFYRVNNLSEGFTNLDTTLSSTLLQTKQFRAVHDFVGTDSAKYLEFKRGDIVTVIDTVGEEKGWWRGRVGERIGFFPMTYVEKLSSSSSDETLNDSTI